MGGKVVFYRHQKALTFLSDKFRNKYRSESTRLRGYDYRSPGAYFVTICTKNRFHYFGKIKNGEMVHSQIGYIAKKHLMEIHDHIPVASLDEFVIMPNHVHCIIIITDDNPVGSFHETTPQPEPIESPYQNPKNEPMSRISPKPGSLPTIIRSYKSSVTKWCNENQIQFAWQSRYHDHIIRSEIEYERIRHYIINNPLQWERDKENK